MRDLTANELYEKKEVHMVVVVIIIIIIGAAVMVVMVAVLLLLLLLLLLLFTVVAVGTVVARWLRCCATNRKVAGSISSGVSGFFIDIKSF